MLRVLKLGCLKKLCIDRISNVYSWETMHARNPLLWQPPEHPGDHFPEMDSHCVARNAPIRGSSFTEQVRLYGATLFLNKPPSCHFTSGLNSRSLSRLDDDEDSLESLYFGSEHFVEILERRSYLRCLVLVEQWSKFLGNGGRGYGQLLQQACH